VTGKPIPSVLLEATADKLYAAQPKVYPREIDGRFARLRLVAVFVLLGIFYVFPWLRWDGHQAVLFDLPARKFHVFALTFWPQDFFWLAWLLIIAGLSLFFFTALAGRLWCGYACPQTVWTEVFLWIERAVEGRRNQRIKLDSGPWTREKILRKSTKQTLWIIFSLWTGFTFVGFFTPILELGREAAAASFSSWEAFWIVFYAFATYGNAGFLREQVCKYMCPYARFQSAMFDRDTLIISYDDTRGEPRGPRRKGTRVLSRISTPAVAAPIGIDRYPYPHPLHSPEGRGGVIVDLRSTTHSIEAGDCVDCDACVQVCPTGIDIRDGLQIECIACASCIDACDAVMDKMQYPRGLIRYTTENMLAGKPRHVLRIRTLVYGGLLLALLGTFLWGVTHRTPVIVEILRDRYALYRETSNGEIENSYALKLVNKTDRAMRLHIALENDHALHIVGKTDIDVTAGQVANVPLTLHAESGAFHGKHDVELRVRSEDDVLDAEYETEFFAPKDNDHEHDRH
jgi:polyferredoxin